MRPSNQAQALMLIYYRIAQIILKRLNKTVEGDAFITYHISYHYF